MCGRVGGEERDDVAVLQRRRVVLRQPRAVEERAVDAPVLHRRRAGGALCLRREIRRRRKVRNAHNNAERRPGGTAQKTRRASQERKGAQKRKNVRSFAQGRERKILGMPPEGFGINLKLRKIRNERENDKNDYLVNPHLWRGSKIYSKGKRSHKITHALLPRPTEKLPRQARNKQKKFTRRKNSPPDHLGLNFKF